MLLDAAPLPSDADRLRFRAEFTDDVMSKLAGALSERSTFTSRDLAQATGLEEAEVIALILGERENFGIETLALLTQGLGFRPELVLHDMRADESDPEPEWKLGQAELDAFVKRGEERGWFDDPTPPRPMTSFIDSLSPEQRAAALAYRGPENIGEAELRLDGPLYSQGPATVVHAGDGGGAIERRGRKLVRLQTQVDSDASLILVVYSQQGRPAFLAVGRMSFETPDGGSGVMSMEDVFDGSRIALGAILDTCTPVMAEAAPLGMVSAEPWEESDESYACRLGLAVGEACSDLDELGAWRHLPRARLVLVEK